MKLPRGSLISTLTGDCGARGAEVTDVACGGLHLSRSRRNRCARALLEINV